MDIACHTKTHPNLTANLTDEQLHQEITYPKMYLENMGFEVRTMIYPYYKWDGRIIDIVKEAGYTCARAGWSEERAFDLRAADPQVRYHVYAWQITEQDMVEFKSIVDRASSQHVVSLAYHFISDSGPEELSTPVANFKEQMSYLKEAGFTVVLLADLFRQ